MKLILALIFALQSTAAFAEVKALTFRCHVVSQDNLFEIAYQELRAGDKYNGIMARDRLPVSVTADRIVWSRLSEGELGLLTFVIDRRTGEFTLLSARGTKTDVIGHCV